MENSDFCRGVIPKRKGCYEFDIRCKSDRSNIYAQIPKQKISLYHLGGRKWSMSPHANQQSVEDAAAEYFIQKGYRKLDHSYITTAAITCALSMAKPESRFWKNIIKNSHTFLVSPRMYDEGYPLTPIWEDTPPRLLQSDREIIGNCISNLEDDFTTRDALIQLSKDLNMQDQRDKATLKLSMEARINDLLLPERQHAILKDALIIFSKFTTKSELRRGQIFGSVFHAFDADKIFENALETGVDQFETALPKVKLSMNEKIIHQRNFRWWLAYRHRPDGLLKFKEFVQSPMLEAEGRRVFGDRWESAYLNTDVDFLDLCVKTFEALGPERLLNYHVLDLWRFVRTQNKSGQSDLIMWDGTNICFIEVKSPNDRLQDNQLDRFNSVMKPADLNYFIAKVCPL